MMKELNLGKSVHFPRFKSKIIIHYICLNTLEPDLLYPKHLLPLIHDISQKELRGFDDCVQEGRLPEDCQNYYKVILRLNDADLFICGTSAFSPKCGVREV